MFDHITLTVENLSKAKDFYKKALEPLNIKVLVEKDGEYCGFGNEKPFFWLGSSDSSHPLSKSIHIAFIGTNKEQVDSFYREAIANGAKDNGAPGYRNEYHTGYYAAFVFDLDGNNIEVVYRE